MFKIAELLRLKYEVKIPHRAIAASLKLSPGSVSSYLKRAKQANLSWPLPAEITEAQLHKRLFSTTESSSTPPPTNVPDWSVVHQELRRKGVTLKLLWQEYKMTHPTACSYSQFCRDYKAQRLQLEPVMRMTHRAGENCFVDYAGQTVPWVDTQTGEVFEAQIFVGCLGASNYAYVEATASQSLRDWLNSHANLFEFFGGTPQNCVPDNLKAAVTKAHRYDPEINLTFQQFAAHYGVAILPARACKPRDKSKVENAVQCVERQLLAPLRHRTFTSLYAINQALWAALPDYNAKPFQKVDGSRTQLFQTLDKPVLKPLPPQRYEWAEWHQAKVHIDYHLVYNKHYYSVPYGLIGQCLRIRVTATRLECYHQLSRVACHTRAYRGGYTTLAAHMPPQHQAHADASKEHVLSKARAIGPHTLAYVQALLQQRAFPQQGFRCCIGLFRLGQQYGQKRLEAACQRAQQLGAYRYRDIQHTLQQGLESAPIQDDPPLQLPLHDNVRGPQYYEQT